MRISDWSSDVCSSDLVHRSRIARDRRVGINVGTVEAAQREIEARRVGRGDRAIGNAADRQELFRGQRGGKVRVAVDGRIVETAVQTAEDAGRVAQAELFLRARSLVPFVAFSSPLADR